MSLMLHFKFVGVDKMIKYEMRIYLEICTNSCVL